MSEPLSSQLGLFGVVRKAMESSLFKGQMQGRLIRLIYRPVQRQGWMRAKVNPHIFKRDKQRLRRKEERQWRNESLSGHETL